MTTLPPHAQADRANADRAQADHVQADLARLFDALAAAPYRHDFFQVLRHIDALTEALTPQNPRLGRAVRPGLEAVRLGQDPELDFAPAAISSFGLTQAVQTSSPPRLGVRFFGLFGPHGALPLHLTELARERERHHADPGMARFADVFHHRLLSLFYRAWAQAQPVVHLDRPDDDQFGKWLGALFGLGPPEFRHRDAVPDAAKRHHAGLLSQGVKNAEGLEMILRHHFGVPVRVEMFVGQWLRLRPQDCTRLGAAHPHTGQLGASAVAGSKVWNRQHKFRIHLGPLTRRQFEAFLPGSPAINTLRDWVRQYLGLGLAWDVRLSLTAAEVPAARLGLDAVDPLASAQPTRLGLSAWLGGAQVRSQPVQHREDLCFGVV
jgi:type VI secretion system protein ImpH